MVSSFLQSHFVLGNHKNNFKETLVISCYHFAFRDCISKTQKSPTNTFFFCYHFLANRNLSCNSLQKPERKINDRFEKNNATFSWTGHLAPSNLFSQDSLFRKSDPSPVSSCIALGTNHSQCTRNLKLHNYWELLLGIPLSWVSITEFVRHKEQQLLWPSPFRSL